MTKPCYWSVLTHFGSPASAAGAAPRAAADTSHKARFQQLLPAGVQTVQLLHGTYKRWGAVGTESQSFSQ